MTLSPGEGERAGRGEAFDAKCALAPSSGVGSSAGEPSPAVQSAPTRVLHEPVARWPARRVEALHGRDAPSRAYA